MYNDLIDINDLKKMLPPLEDLIQGKKTRKGNYIYVEPCPVCGHRNHFIIQNNKFHSFNNCIQGGDNLDWLIRHLRLTWKDLFEKYSNGKDIKKLTKKQQEKNKAKKLEKEKEEQIFNLIYDNLLFIYKTLDKIKNKLNPFGLWLYNWSDLWTNFFINCDDKKQTLNKFKQDIKTEVPYSIRNT